MKTFIKKHLLLSYKTSIGINSARLKKSWFDKNNFSNEYDTIISMTSFLITPSFGERLYCVMNDISEIEKCPICKDNVKFANYIEGYRNHCGKRQCSYELKAMPDEHGESVNSRAATQLKQTLSIVGNDGLTSAQRRVEKINESLNKLIDGKTVRTLNAEKSARTKKNTYINDKSLAQIAAEKSAVSMSKTNEFGETICSLRIQKMIETKSKVNEDGLDGFEMSFKNGAGRASSLETFEDTNIFYQGTYEKDFLMKMKYEGLLEQIERGPRIPYVHNGKNKQYRSDFKLNDLVIEIKSDWTYYSNKTLNTLKFKETIKYNKLLLIVNKDFFVLINEGNVDKNLLNFLRPISEFNFRYYSTTLEN